MGDAAPRPVTLPQPRQAARGRESLVCAYGIWRGKRGDCNIRRMERRDFLQRTALAGAAALTPRSAHAAQSRVPAFAFEESTIATLQERMAEGALTARQLTEAYLARIAAVDRSGPRLNSVIEVNPDALAMAEACDRERT